MSLRKAELPETENGARSTLGTCKVHWRLVKGFAKAARPLTLLASNEVFDPLPKVTEEQTKALQDLKWRLTDAPIVALPQCEGQYTVEKYASATQVDCFLLQKQPAGGHEPVWY